MKISRWTTPFVGGNFLDLLERHARDCRGEKALVWEDGGLDYGTLWQLMEKLACGLSGRGWGAGQRVFLVMDASRACILFYLGLLRLGAVVVVVDPGLPAAQWLRRLADLEPVLVIGPLATLAGISPASGWERLDLTDDVVAKVVQEGKEGVLPSPPDCDDPVVIMATTGTTTGISKYVPLTLGNISAAARQINDTMGLTGSDVEVITLPLCHSFGLGRLRCLLMAGGCAHIFPGRFRPERLLKAVRAVGATVFAQVPAGIRLLLALGERIRPWLAGVRLVEIGSATLDVGEKERLADLLPQARLWHHYGMTEASRSLFLEYHGARALGRLGALGRCVVGVETELLAAVGLRVDDGEGELAVRGPHVTPGYWVPPGQRGGEGDNDQWFGTGDLVRRDSQGFFYYLGRVDDVINLGGFKVHPLEVETVLANCPGVADVAVAISRGGGQGVLIAFVQPDSSHAFDEGALRDWLQRRLEPYKHPQVYRKVATLPRTASGKLLRRELPLDEVSDK